MNTLGHLRATRAAIVLSLSVAVSTFAQDAPVEVPADVGETEAVGTVVVAAPGLTKLDAFERQPGAVVTRTVTRQPALTGDDRGTLTVGAVTMRAGDQPAVTGLLVEVASRSGRRARAYVDADQIDALAGAVTALSKVERPDGHATDVGAFFRTATDTIQIRNIDENGGRLAVVRVVHYAPTLGQVWTAGFTLHAGRLAELGRQIATAKEMLARGNP